MKALTAASKPGPCTSQLTMPGLETTMEVYPEGGGGGGGEGLGGGGRGTGGGGGLGGGGLGEGGAGGGGGGDRGGGGGGGGGETVHAGRTLVITLVLAGTPPVTGPAV